MFKGETIIISNIWLQNDKKACLIGLIFFFCLILSGLIGSVSNAENLNLSNQQYIQADSNFCNEYARTAIRQFHEAKSKGCSDLDFPAWRENIDYHRGWCRKGTVAMAKRELLKRQNQINQCSGTSDFQENKRSGLMYKWNLKHVAYKNKQKTFVPKTHEGFRLFPNGTIAWSDGCNKKFARYTLFGKIIHIGKPSSTLIGCLKEIEDVHYEDVTIYALAGDRLTLETPTQIYRLERYPFSEMSLNPWSLHSIIHRNTGESRNLDRFRTGYRHLFLEIKDDQKFSFHDLDQQIYAGVIQIGQKGQVRMHYTDESQEILGKRKKTYDYLSDSTNKYKKTKKKYATYYADELDWNSVNFFKIENRELFFYSKDEIYKFEPR